MSLFEQLCFVGVIVLVVANVVLNTRR